MKKIVLLLLLNPLFVFSQKSINVKERSENIGGGNNNCLVVTIYEAKQSEIEKAWKSELKKLDGKVSDKKEIFADDAKMKSMGDNTFDLYSKVVKVKDDEHELWVGVDLGGAFLSSSQHSSQYKAMKDFVYVFALNTSKEAMAGQVKEAEKTQRKLEKEKEDLISDKEKLKKNIEDYKKKIEEAEKNISQNEKNQDAKQKEIEVQMKVVEGLKAKEKSIK